MFPIAILVVVISLLTVGLFKVTLYIILVPLAIMCICFLFIKQFRYLLPLFLILMLVTYSGICKIGSIEKAAAPKGTVTVNGTITEIKGNKTSVSYIVKVKEINGKPLNSKFSLSSVLGLNLNVGEKIIAEAELYEPELTTYNLSNGIYRNGFIYRTVSVENERNFYSILENFRKNSFKKFASVLSTDEASLLTGLSLGDKDFLSDQLKNNIRRSGISHAVVVSGMHISIIASAFLRLTQKLKIGNKLLGVLGLCLIFLICAATGFTISSIRSGVTFIIMFVGYLFNRRPDALNSLLCAVTLILLLNPMAVCSLSFQLSVSATFGVLVVAKRMQNILCKRLTNGVEKIIKIFVSIVITTTCATVTTLPFIVYYFSAVSLVSVFTNMILTYAITFALLLTLPTLLMPAQSAVFNLFLLLAGLLSRCIIYVVNVLGSLPFAEVVFKNNFVPTLVFAAAGLALSAFALYKFDSEDSFDGTHNRTGIEEKYRQQ